MVQLGIQWKINLQYIKLLIQNRIQDTGYRIQDTGYTIQDTRYRIQDTG